MFTKWLLLGYAQQELGPPLKHTDPTEKYNFQTGVPRNNIKQRSR